MGIKANKFEFEWKTAKFDLTLYVMEGEDGIELLMEYNTDLFDQPTIHRMLGHYQMLLTGAIAEPDLPISQLPLLTEAEQNQILVKWNDTKTVYPRDKCVNELFEVQAEKTPDSIAVIFEDAHLTYRDLNIRSNRLAHYLKARGVGPGVLVGLYMERSLEMVVSLLAIMKAGGIYIPLDPSYPMQRITYMLEDSEADVLVTQDHLIEQLPASGLQIVRVDSDWAEIEREEPDNLRPSAGAQDLSYVIYTSGSTGKPKGVAISHGALINFLWSMKQEPGLTEKDVLLSVTTLSFDIAALELFLPLIVGAQIVLVSREVAMDARRLIMQLEDRGVTVMQATPATWRMLLQADWKGRQDLKILIGGEALAEELANELLPRCAELWNMYGPTETTIWSTIWQVDSDRDRILIGCPIANTQVYILDRSMQPVPFGVAGELFIGGDGLAREYLKRPELTAEKFIGNPFQNISRNGDNASKLIYRTGDLARWLPDGQIECLGRIDHQVKIRGFRIELGEIEAVLSEDPGVAQCVVVAREDIPGNKRLVAYIVPHNEAPAVDALRQQLKKELADYMIPSAFVTMDQLPLTPNGKVDRKALPEPDTERPDLENAFIGPRNSTEELIGGPRNSTEELIGYIWCEVLGLKQVGIHDNFFELGGHSLLILQVHSKLQQEVNPNIETMDLFKYPTVAGLAERMDTESEGDHAASQEFYTLFPIQTNGARPPFFWFHSGLIRDFLPDYVGKDQPLYALVLQGFDGKRVRYKTTQEIAENYIREIRAIQPSGPYYLGGFCWGGWFAFEVGNILIQEGEDVALLFLIEPGLSSKPVNSSHNSSNESSHWIIQHFHAFAQLPLSKKISYFSDKFIGRCKWLKAVLKKLYVHLYREAHFRTGRPLPSSYRLDYAFDVIFKAAPSYIQPIYPKDIVLIRGEEGNDPNTDWSNLAEGEVKVHVVPGAAHMGLIEGDHVSVWAKLLNTYLRKAQTK